MSPREQLKKLLEWEKQSLKRQRRRLFRVHLPRLILMFFVGAGSAYLLFSDEFTNWILEQRFSVQVAVILTEYVGMFYFCKLMSQWGKEIEKD